MITAISTGTLVTLALALTLACVFEFVNGFHDTANAVATVIYTRSLRPWAAVMWSGLCNFLGVFVGGIAVALSILHLLPFDLVLAGGGGSMAMVFSLLGAAILWNVGTWYLGIPASSSHTLIGAILGVGLANGIASGVGVGASIHWGKAIEVGLSLLVSPLLGFALTALMLVVARRLIRHPELYRAPAEGERPPGWIRATLILTCTGVSFAHGSNDGQKGVGLIMLILIGLVPGAFAVNPNASPEELGAARAAALRIEARTRTGTSNVPGAVAAFEALRRRALRVVDAVGTHKSLEELPGEARQSLRRTAMLLSEGAASLRKAAPDALPLAGWQELEADTKAVLHLVEYAPTWVLLLVALSLGIGTMIGWRRIVVTVGEKIGKSHLTFAQGAAAELVAMSTIGLAALSGAPVSTTHVLSSGVAGAMFAERSGLQATTIRKIALAWLLTLPVSMALAAGLFALLRQILV